MTRRKKKYLIAFGILIVLVVNAYILLHIYASPESIRQTIKNLAREELNCDVEIGSVEASLLGVLKANNVQLFLPDKPEEPALTIDRVLVDSSPLRLLWGQGGFDELEINGPSVSLSKEFIQSLSAGGKEKKAPADHSMIPRKITINSGEIEIAPGFAYRNSPKFKLTDLQLSVQASSFSAPRLTFVGSANDANLGEIEMNGLVNLIAQSLSLKVDVPKVGLDSQLKKLVPPEGQKVWNDLGLEGAFGVALNIDYGWGEKQYLKQQFTATPSDVTVRIKDFPIPVTNLTGKAISDGESVSIKQMVGRYRDGTVEVTRGFVDKKISEFEVLARSMPVTDEIHENLPPEVKEVYDQLNISGGSADSIYHIRLDKTGEKPYPEQSLELTLQNIAACYKEFPYPIDRINGKLRWHTPKKGEKRPSWVEMQLNCDAGDALIGISGRIAVPPPVKGLKVELPEGEEPYIKITARGLPLDEKLRKALPKEVVDIMQEMNAAGNVDAVVRLDFGFDGRTSVVKSKSVAVTLNGVQAKLKSFPYQVTNLTGRFEWDGRQVRFLGINGLSGEAQVSLGGSLNLEKKADSLSKTGGITVTVQGLEFDQRLRAALDENMQELWDDLSPSGKGNAFVALNFADDGQMKVQKLSVTLAQSKATYKDFPYALENLTGNLTVENNVATLQNVVGHVPESDAKISISGKIVTDPEAPEKGTLIIRGDHLALDDNLRTALGEIGDQIWESFLPEGHVNVSCQIAVTKDSATLTSANVELDHCSAIYQDFPYPLASITGRIRLQEENVITLDNVVGYAGLSTVRLVGQIYREQEQTAENNDAEHKSKTGRLTIQARDIAFDEDLLQAVPEVWKDVWSKVQPKGSFNGDFTLLVPDDGSDPTIEQGSTFSLHNFSLRGFPLPESTFTIEMNEEYLSIPEFTGTYYGGRIIGKPTEDGEPAIKLGRRNSRWAIHLEIYDIDVKQINDEQQFMAGDKDLRGQLTATIDMKGQDTDPQNYEGVANVAIRNGKLANIPVIADVFMSLLNFTIPKSETITGAEIAGTLLNGKVSLSKILFTGTSVPISGEGTIGLDGKLDMNFYTSKDKETFISWIPLVGPLVDKQIISRLRNLIVQVRVTGTVYEPKAKIVPFKAVGDVVTAPVRLLISVFQSEKKEE